MCRFFFDYTAMSVGPDGVASFRNPKSHGCECASMADAAAAADEAVPLSRLALEPFVMFPRVVGTGVFDTIITACREAGFTPRVVQEAPQFTSIIGLVSAGLGVALIPSALGRIRLDGVVYRPLLGTDAAAPVVLVRRRRDASAAVAAFVRAARAAIRKP